VGVQVLAYALGLLGLASSRASTFRLVRLATAFVGLNWFAVLGFARFVSGKDLHLWDSRPGGPAAGAS